MSTKPRLGTTCRWGKIDHLEEITDGIWWVSTPSHGGILVDGVHNRQIPGYMRDVEGSYEEDCDWAIVATVFGDYFTEKQRRHARNILRDWNPKMYEQFYGVTLGPGLSYIKDQETAEVSSG